MRGQLKKLLYRAGLLGPKFLYFLNFFTCIEPEKSYLVTEYQKERKENQSNQVMQKQLKRQLKNSKSNAEKQQASIQILQILQAGNILNLTIYMLSKFSVYVLNDPFLISYFNTWYIIHTSKVR